MINMTGQTPIYISGQGEYIERNLQPYMVGKPIQIPPLVAKGLGRNVRRNVPLRRP